MDKHSHSCEKMSRSNSIADNSLGGGMNGMLGYGASVESIVTNEIVKLVTSSFCGDNLKSTLISLFGKLWKIAVLYGVQYFIKNTKGLSSFLSSLFRLVIYKKTTLNIKDNESIDFLFYKKIETFLSANNEDAKAQSVNGFKIYGQKIDNNVHIEYIPLFHNSFMNNLRCEAKESLKDYQDSKEILVNSITSKRKPMELYASKNFIKTARIIQEFFRVKKCRDSFSTQAVLIDGIPGLGKTVFLDYVAFEKLASQIISMNLTREEYRKMDFGACMDKLYNMTITGTCVVHVDEIDKHLDYRIKTKYHDMVYREGTSPGNSGTSSPETKPSPKSSPKDKEEEKSESSTDSKPNIPSFEEFREDEKIKFLYQLTDLIESKHFSFGVVIILTCNNFESIFDGVDMTHFHSLKRRFLKVRFEKCDKEDFIGYCKFYNDSFKEKCQEKYIPEDEFEKLCSEISPSFDVPFWIIQQEMVSASFSIRDLIRTINNLPSEDPLLEMHENTIPKLFTPPLINKVVYPKENYSKCEILPPKKENIILEEKPLSNPLDKVEKEEEEDEKGVEVCSECEDKCYERYKCQNNNCSKRVCEKCLYTCGRCDDNFCKEHYITCEKCEAHIHDNEDGSKSCLCCKLCGDIVENEDCCTACGESLCDNCFSDRLKTFECKRCENMFCISHICSDCDLKSQCDRCCLDLEHSEKPKVVNGKYNCEIPDVIIDGILKNIPPHTSSKNILGEIKNYEVCGNISSSYVEIVDRIFNCEDCVSSIVAFLGLTQHTRIPLKIYVIVKMFEYILCEKNEKFIYDEKTKKFRETILKKIEEFEQIDLINRNEKFISITNEIKARFARVDRE